MFEFPAGGCGVPGGRPDPGHAQARPGSGVGLLSPSHWYFFVVMHEK
jgi:hypothetical protein